MSATISSTVPCHRGGHLCRWPACPQECDGRPWFPHRLTDQKFDAVKEVYRKWENEEIDDLGDAIKDAIK